MLHNLLLESVKRFHKRHGSLGLNLHESLGNFRRSFLADIRLDFYWAVLKIEFNDADCHQWLKEWQRESIGAHVESAHFHHTETSKLDKLYLLPCNSILVFCQFFCCWDAIDGLHSLRFANHHILDKSGQNKMADTIRSWQLGQSSCQKRSDQSTHCHKRRLFLVHNSVLLALFEMESSWFILWRIVQVYTALWLCIHLSHLDWDDPRCHNLLHEHQVLSRDHCC